MPSRMPNWKMRAKALVDGRPTTRLCRMPSCGSACMMRTRRSTASAGHEAVGVEHDREFVVAAPALAEVADVAGLEAGVLVAPAIGDGNASAPTSRASAANARFLGRGDARVARCRSARRRWKRSPTPVATSPSSIGSRLRTTRSGGFVADADQDRGRGGDRLVAAHAPAAGVTAATGSRAKRMIRKPIVAFQKPITDPRQRHREQHQQQRYRRRRSRRPTARRASEPEQPGHGQPDQREEQQPAGRSSAAASAVAAVGSGRRSSMRDAVYCLRGYEDIARAAADSPIRDATAWRDQPDDEAPGALVCRARAAPNCARRRCRARGRRRARARALRRDQPRHRTRWCSPGACRRANSSACARRSWAARFRFRSNMATPRSAASRTGRQLRGRTVFALHPHQSVSRCRPRPLCRCPTTCRRARGARRQYGDRAQRGLGRRARPGRPHRGRRRRRGRRCWSRYLCARLAGRRGHAGRYRPGARRACASARRRLRDAGRGAGRLRSRLPCQRHARRASPPRCGSPATRRRSSS